MSNTFVTTALAVPVAAEFETSAPVLMNMTRSFDKNFVANNGETISIILPGYGTSAVAGADLTGANLDYVNQSVSVTLQQYRKGVSFTAVEQALKLSNYAADVAEPYGSEFSSDIQSKAITAMHLAAETAVVVESFGTTNGFSDLGKAISYVAATKLKGEMAGALSNELTSLVLNNAISQFNPNGAVSDMFLKGKLGTFRNVPFYETSDDSAITGGTLAPASGNITIKTEVNTDATGDYSTIVLTGNTLAGTLKAGEILYATGVKSVNVFGKATTTNFAFVVQEDATAAAGDISVKVQPLFFKPATGIKPKQNVSVASLAATTVVTRGTTAGSTYVRGLVWSKKAAVYASRPMKALAVQESAAANGEAVSILMQRDANLLTGIDLVTYDALIGFRILRGYGVSSILVKV